MAESKKETQEQSETVLTSIEAKKILDMSLEKYIEAQEAMEIALLRERDYQGLVLRIEKQQVAIENQKQRIADLLNMPNVKNHAIIKSWQSKLHDHLNGHELMNDEDLEDLFKALQKI